MSHWNVSLPPVGLPFLILIDDVEYEVIRHSYLTHSEGTLEYESLLTGEPIKGKFPWRYK